jgi:hypothetical protein
MEVNGQLHAFPFWTQGNTAQYPLDRRLREPQRRSGQRGEKSRVQGICTLNKLNIWEANSCSDAKEMFIVLCNPKVGCHVHKSPPLHHNSPSYFFHIHISINAPATLMSTKYLLLHLALEFVFTVHHATITIFKFQSFSKFVTAPHVSAYSGRGQVGG